MKRLTTTPCIAVLMKRFPKLSETFILGELLGLEQAGFKLQIYSLYLPSDQSCHPQCKELRAPVVYLPAIANSPRLTYIQAHCKLALFRPLRYLRALFTWMLRRQQEEKHCFLMAGWLAQELLTNNQTHLYTHFVSEPGSVAELVQALSGISFSLSAHARDIYLLPPKELVRKLRAAQFTVTCTEYNRRYLQSLTPENACIHRMYHGIDFSRVVAGGVRSPELSEEVPLILSTGRLREKKGFHVLIEACRQLKNSGIDYRCDIVGYGPQREQLQQQIKNAGLGDRLCLRGKLGHVEVIELFRLARLFVLPCIVDADGDRDGIPNVILEALAMKVPVVTTDISGIPEIIQHRKTGLLVRQGDAASLAGSLLELLKKPALGDTLANAGYDRVREMFSNSGNLKLLEQLLVFASVDLDGSEFENNHGVSTV